MAEMFGLEDPLPCLSNAKSAEVNGMKHQDHTAIPLSLDQNLNSTTLPNLCPFL